MLYQLSYGTDIMVKRKNSVLMSFVRFVYAICTYYITRYYLLHQSAMLSKIAQAHSASPTSTFDPRLVCITAGISSEGRYRLFAGLHPRGGGEGPLGPENTIFSRFLPLNYAICIFEMFFF